MSHPYFAIRFYNGEGHWSRWIVREEPIEAILKELIEDDNEGELRPFQLAKVDLKQTHTGAFVRGENGSQIDPEGLIAGWRLARPEELK